MNHKTTEYTNDQIREMFAKGDYATPFIDAKRETRERAVKILKEEAEEFWQAHPPASEDDHGKGVTPQEFIRDLGRQLLQVADVVEDVLNDCHLKYKEIAQKDQRIAELEAQLTKQPEHVPLQELGLAKIRIQELEAQLAQQQPEINVETMDYNDLADLEDKLCAERHKRNKREVAEANERIAAREAMFNTIEEADLRQQEAAMGVTESAEELDLDPAAPHGGSDNEVGGIDVDTVTPSQGEHDSVVIAQPVTENGSLSPAEEEVNKVREQLALPGHITKAFNHQYSYEINYNFKINSFGFNKLNTIERLYLLKATMLTIMERPLTAEEERLIDIATREEGFDFVKNTGYHSSATKLLNFLGEPIKPGLEYAKPVPKEEEEECEHCEHYKRVLEEYKEFNAEERAEVERLQALLEERDHEIEVLKAKLAHYEGMGA
jgi:hypothetical protein